MDPIPEQEVEEKEDTIERDDPNTEVFSWGCDQSGQLGLGSIHG
jgi:hypothetical protein